MTAYTVLRSAILAKQQVTCRYGGHYREICPHAIGTKGDIKNVISYQFGGSSNSGLPREGEWRCMDVSRITDAAARIGDWHTGTNHSKPQTCVDEIDVEVKY